MLPEVCGRAPLGRTTAAEDWPRAGSPEERPGVRLGIRIPQVHHGLMHKPVGRIIETRIPHHDVGADGEHACRNANSQDEGDRDPPPQPSRCDRAAVSCAAAATHPDHGRNGQLSRRFQPVANAPHGRDQDWMGWVGLDLCSKSLNRDVHQPRVTQELVVPNELEQHLAREHLARPARKHRQQPELSRRQAQLTAAERGTKPGLVNRDVTHAPYPIPLRRLGPAQHRAHPATSSAERNGLET